MEMLRCDYAPIEWVELRFVGVGAQVLISPHD